MTRAHRVLALLAAAELLGMSAWFTGNAVAGELAATWGLGAGEVGWLTAAVQLGFVFGTALAAVLNLPDLIPARAYLPVAALAAAVANASLVVAPSYELALGCRALTGFFLAGVYPPGMKMAATWFREGRGLAIGILVGALTVGKATPYLLKASGLSSASDVVLASSAAAIIAALLVGWGYRDGPHAFPRRPFSWQLVATVVGHRETRLATAGYLGHMWELYAMWTWVPAFVAASLAGQGDGWADAIAFLSIAMGGAGCVWGGWAAGRRGYAWVTTTSMKVSGTCALLIGALLGASPWILTAALCLWGFFVVSDSAQFSSMVTEVAPPHAVGTALTLQTSVGFLLTMATIQLIPLLVGVVGWSWAFSVLALGPAAGVLAIRRLRAFRPHL